ncbi:OmpW/AlkL family protein [Cellvibrio sp. UBA7661]|uniref:OmpW/AlkL family protein n=1 Tax=Cellvibrio sp. UBA7661 TaxID=1946311 RepID=UPI002F3522E6
MRHLGLMVLLGSACIAAPVMAHEDGEFFVRVGAVQIEPDASSGTVLGGGVDVDSATGIGFSGTWFATPHIGIELLAALPFEHDIVGTGALDGVDIGSTKHLPPTLSLQYYPLSESKFQPYIGIGLNYTTFFSSDTSNTLDTALAGKTDISLDDSVGLAFQVGADWQLTDNWYLNAAVWKIDIETTADISVNGKKAASVDVSIDPLVVMVGAGYAF